MLLDLLWHKQPISKEHPFYPWIVLIVILFVTNMLLIAAVATSIAEPYIQGHFRLGVTESSWVGSSFLLMMGATVPIGMRYSEKYGYKITFFIGCILFFFGSLLVALAPDFAALLTFRFVSGIGTGIIMPLSLGLIALSFPKSMHSLAFSLYTGFGFGLGYVAGCFLGGYFSEYLSWKAIFYATFLLGIPSLLIVAIFFHETPRKAVRSKLDIFGYASFLFLIVSLVMIFINAKAPWNTEGWHSVFSYSFYAIACISFVLLIIVELKVEKPMFPLFFFSVRPFVIGSIAVFCLGTVLFGTSAFLPVVLKNDLLWPSHQIGVHMSSLGASVGVFGIITGLTTKKIGIRTPTVIGLALCSISCFMNHSMTIYSDHGEIMGVLIVRGAGIGIGLGPVTAISLKKISSEFQGKAAVLVTIFRQMGAAIGTLALGAIMVMREVFHRQRFSEMIDRYSPSWERTYSRVTGQSIEILGDNIVVAKEKADSFLSNLINRQAHIAAFDDVFFLMGIVIGLIALTIVILVTRAVLIAHFSRKKRKALLQN